MNIYSEIHYFHLHLSYWPHLSVRTRSHSCADTVLVRATYCTLATAADDDLADDGIDDCVNRNVEDIGNVSNFVVIADSDGRAADVGRPVGRLDSNRMVVTFVQDSNGTCECCKWSAPPAL